MCVWDPPPAGRPVVRNNKERSGRVSTPAVDVSPPGRCVVCQPSPWVTDGGGEGVINPELRTAGLYSLWTQLCFKGILHYWSRERPGSCVSMNPLAK